MLRVFYQIVLFALCAVPVFVVMILLSAGNVAAPDATSDTQHMGRALGDMVGFPTLFLPSWTPALIQFCIVLLFWTALLRLMFFVIFNGIAEARKIQSTIPVASPTDRQSRQEWE